MAQGGAITRATRVRAVTGALFFAAGVLTVFVALGASASVFGQVLRDWFDVLRYVAAALIIAMGLHFLGVIRIGFLKPLAARRTGRHGEPRAWRGLCDRAGLCLRLDAPRGPGCLRRSCSLAGTTDSAGQGMTLLTAYGIGMTLPFVLAAGFVGPFHAG